MDLEKEVFNLKLKCHEYERRLDHVGLGGVNGAAIQEENMHLKETVNRLEQETLSQTEKVDSLTNICIKTRSALEDLQNSNKKKADNIKSLEEQLMTKDRALDNLKISTNEMMSALEGLPELKSSLTELSSENQTLKLEKDQLSKEVFELKANLDGFEQTKKEISDVKACLAVKTSECDRLSSEMKELIEVTTRKTSQLESNLKVTLASESEKLSLESRKTVNSLSQAIAELKEELRIEKKNKDEKICEIERYRVREANINEEMMTLKNEMCKMNVLLKNYEATKENELRIRDLDYEAKIRELDLNHENTLREMQRASTSNLSDSRSEQEKLISEIELLKKRHQDEIQLKTKELARAKEDYRTLKQKWMSSITNKKPGSSKRSSSVTGRSKRSTGSLTPNSKGRRFGNLLDTRLTGLADPAGSTGRRLFDDRDSNSVVTAATSRLTNVSNSDENSSRFSNSIADRGRSRASSNSKPSRRTIEVKSRFMEVNRSRRVSKSSAER